MSRVLPDSPNSSDNDSQNSPIFIPSKPNIDWEKEKNELNAEFSNLETVETDTLSTDDHSFKRLVKIANAFFSIQDNKYQCFDSLIKEINEHEKNNNKQAPVDEIEISWTYNIRPKFSKDISFIKELNDDTPLSEKNKEQAECILSHFYYSLPPVRYDLPNTDIKTTFIDHYITVLTEDRKKIDQVQNLHNDVISYIQTTYARLGQYTEHFQKTSDPTLINAYTNNINILLGKLHELHVSVSSDSFSQILNSYSNFLLQRFEKRSRILEGALDRITYINISPIELSLFLIKRKHMLEAFVAKFKGLKSLENGASISTQIRSIIICPKKDD